MPETQVKKVDASDVNVGEIINRIWSPSSEDIERIKRAYEIAQEAHATQTRYSGDPYFTHVFETAKILAELGMDTPSIIAGLLHDTIEDTDLGEDLIRDEFGSDVLFLVQGVTKLGHVRYRGQKRHIESLRKLFVATSQDIRVLIIKLADRLHNMRTLEYVPDGKRKRIAAETMEVYAPIAHRLGIGRLKGQLEDLAFPFINKPAYEEVKQISADKYEESVRNLKSVHKELSVALEEENVHDVEIDYRLKHLYSLWKKLQRKDNDIDRVYDIAALRVIVTSVSDCYRVLGIVHGIWQPLQGRIKDYIAFKKPNGYQSIHTTIFTGEGGIAEIQIRTRKMHEEAEFGIASHVRYKENATSASNWEWLSNLLSSVQLPKLGSNQSAKKKSSNKKGAEPDVSVPNWVKEMADAQEEASEEEFMSNLHTDFFKNRIFVFTPKGDVIDLPVDATPIDFAYYIHSDIGDHIAGAKVGGKLVSLDTPLQNGDIVEIQTDKNNSPKHKWLEYAQTTQARRKIRSAISKNE